MDRSAHLVGGGCDPHGRPNIGSMHSVVRVAGRHIYEELAARCTLRISCHRAVHSDSGSTQVSHECELPLGSRALRRRASLCSALCESARQLAEAACFPGAHSSSGFSLMCFYFVLRAKGGAERRGGHCSAPLRLARCFPSASKPVAHIFSPTI